MSEFRMPSLGADMEAGTLVEWLKAPGEHVSKGDIIAVVETQKGAIEIEIFEDGVIGELLVEPGQKVPVGAPLALVNGAADAEPVAAPPPTPVEEEVAVVVPAAPSPPTAPKPAAGPRPRISPAARRRATELGVDIAAVIGKGDGGAITLQDVESHAKAPPAKPPAEAQKAAMRQAISAAMARSNREIPHYHLSDTVDLAPMTEWLETANRDRPVTERLLAGAVILKAVALALREVPDLNGYWRDDAFAPADAVNVGWATSLRGGGLIAPAIVEADKLTLDEVMVAMRDLVKRARAGGLRSSELSEGTVTVTSLGDNGVESVHGVIYPPQVALVGFGRIERRPWVVGEDVVPRTVVTTSLSADHRASDGQRGAKFLNVLDRLLQEPERL